MRSWPTCTGTTRYDRRPLRCGHVFPHYPQARSLKMASRKDIVRTFIPDSHGAHCDIPARDAFLRDLKRLNPDQIVMLGDHLDCGGVFSTHARAFTNEMTESYAEDLEATNDFLDLILKAAPRAQIWYHEGNHEARVERFATGTFQNQKDAKNFLAVYGVEASLDLKRRGVKYIKRSEFYGGVSIPGTMKFSVNGVDVFTTHGISAAKNATAVHLARFGSNVVHGHTHRAAAVYGRTVVKASIGAWSPGTLAQLQPLYLHTNPSDWSLGYDYELVSASGLFIHQHVPLVKGQSMLDQVAKVVGGRKRPAA